MLLIINNKKSFFVKKPIFLDNVNLLYEADKNGISTFFYTFNMAKAAKKKGPFKETGD